MKKEIKSFLFQTYVLFLDVFLLVYLLLKYISVKISKNNRNKLQKSNSQWQYIQIINKQKKLSNIEFQILKRFLNLYPRERSIRRKNLSDFTYEMF
tara:strand:- start:1149 stop:1436 length:288 start_codon:yes stop_codon:yes gene_type:complete